MDPKTIGAIVTVLVALVSALTAWRERRAKLLLEQEKLDLEKEKLRLEAAQREVGGLDFNQLMLTSQQKVNETYAASLSGAQEQVRALVQDFATLHAAANEARIAANKEIGDKELELREAIRACTALEYANDRMSILTKRLYQRLASDQDSWEAVAHNVQLSREWLDMLLVELKSGEPVDVAGTLVQVLGRLSVAYASLSATMREINDMLDDVSEEYKELREDSEVT